MTVTYSGQVSNARLSAFARLLFYWKGSIYKLMYKEMIIFITLYATCSLVYRFALNGWQRDIFEKIALHCETFTNLIPLSFVLGFYVAIVVNRWWNQFMCIPWPDRVSLYVMTLVDGYDDHSRLVRRTIVRYLMQSTLLTLQNTSVSVKKRFPTIEHLVEAGVMTPNEVQMLEDVATPHGRWWVPMNWVFNLVKDARQQGLIADDFLFKTVLEELMAYRSNLGMLYNYDWISIPLVYTQVTTLSVYTFFIGCILGRQFLDPTKSYPGHDVDLFVPVFTLLQFFFYMGWMKVAEQMINPFGEDDDDFDMNWIIDRNMQLSLMYVDDFYGVYPKMEKDVYWDDAPPPFLPYTKLALSNIKKPFMGSTADFSITEDQMKVINPMETIREEPTAPINIPEHHVPGSSKLTSNVTSPLGSPHHSRPNLTQNILLANQLRSQLSLSKSTLDGLKLPPVVGSAPAAVTIPHPSLVAVATPAVESTYPTPDNVKPHPPPPPPPPPQENKPLVQTLNGATTLPKAPSYIDGWLNQEPGSRFDISSVPARLPSPLTHSRALSQAMARGSQMTLPVHCDLMMDSASVFSMEKAESSVAPSAPPSIVPSVSASAAPSMAPSIVMNFEDDRLDIHEIGGVDRQQHMPPPPAYPAVATDKSDSVEVSIPSAAADNALSSSSESFPEYELPESNQCTVTSLTPLLKSVGKEDLV